MTIVGYTAKLANLFYLAVITSSIVGPLSHTIILLCYEVSQKDIIYDKMGILHQTYY